MMLLVRARSIFCLPALRLSASAYAARHAHDESLDQCTWYATPALFQSLTKAILVFLSVGVFVVLWVELVHALLEDPPEVFY